MPKTKKTKITTKAPVVQTYDMFGNRIQTGDYINYPGRSGSSLYMRTAKVLNVKTRLLAGGVPEIILSVAMALHDVGGKKTQVTKTTLSVPVKTTVLPKAYVENDKRYACLLDV